MALKINSVKKIQIDKDMKLVVIWVAIASFITIFSLISGYSLYKIMNYQNQVISSNSSTLSVLKSDQNSLLSLASSYQKFNNQPVNIIGGSISSNNQNNGNNSKIILDALPSSLDYPALLSSVQSLLSTEGVTINSITGTGGPSSVTSSNQNSSSPQPLTFSFSVSGGYQNIQNVITTLQNSIRPMQFQSIDISGNQSSLSLSATVQTYYQPGIGFNVSKEILP